MGFQKILQKNIQIGVLEFKIFFLGSIYACLYVSLFQMLSALVLQLVQSVAKIPIAVEQDQRQTVIDGKVETHNVDELTILSSLDMSYQVGYFFLQYIQ